MAERRKRNRTNYVEPGSKFVVYVPVDTPPIVCEFLNKLKDEGAFSLDVMDILTQHVRNLEAQAKDLIDGTSESVESRLEQTTREQDTHVASSTRSAQEDLVQQDQIDQQEPVQQSSVLPNTDPSPINNMDLVMRLNRQSKTLKN